MKMGRLERLKEFYDKGNTSSEEAKSLAREVYLEGLPSHQCYWNDRFCIAMDFDLDPELKREAAERLEQNARQGYYEPITHFKFDLNKTLIQNGVPEVFLPKIPSEGGIHYDHVSQQALAPLLKKLGVQAWA